MEPRPLSELFETLREDRKEAKRLLKRQGELIRGMRDQAQMSQQAFANAAGISNSYLSLVEHGERTISTDTLNRMEQALAVNQTGGTNVNQGSTAKEDAAKARSKA